ncbi:hypothetical protein Fuma_01907 [Fuerstiella marisgermanici]|uniref:Uncharacterized protein n=1 Tax=Fuerstiella marisgermanici TaxID=1891926 RepID=A0A1P8WE55_9PLAN|nr:hypothetical protein Fuma_01907 [Fuerstiella marisgermanici]
MQSSESCWPPFVVHYLKNEPVTDSNWHHPGQNQKSNPGVFDSRPLVPRGTSGFAYSQSIDDNIDTHRNPFHADISLIESPCQH